MRALYKSNIRGKYWPIVLARSADTRAINFSFLRKMNILFFFVCSFGSFIRWNCDSGVLLQCANSEFREEPTGSGWVFLSLFRKLIDILECAPTI